MAIKVGTRLRSRVDDTEVIVVRADDSVGELTCGGRPFAHIEADGTRLPMVPGADAGNQLGKRYTVAGSTLELLVTKAGNGTLAAGGSPLTTKDARPLPASD